jgi:hypothetical protein
LAIERERPVMESKTAIAVLPTSQPMKRETGVAGWDISGYPLRAYDCLRACIG